MIDTLSAIFQAKDQSLPNYIERYNKEVILVREANHYMKMYPMKEGLLEGSQFTKDIGLKKPKRLNA